jgi:hypothetical protein
MVSFLVLVTIERVIIDIIEKMNQYHILGLIDPIKEVGTEVLGY